MSEFASRLHCGHLTLLWGVLSGRLLELVAELVERGDRLAAPSLLDACQGAVLSLDASAFHNLGRCCSIHSHGIAILRQDEER